MRIYLDYEFDDWNTYIFKERSNKYWANESKKKEEYVIKMLTIGKEYKGKYPVKLKITKYFKDKKSDLDGINTKILIDGLVRAKVIKNDNLNCIQKIEINPKFDKTKKGIEVEIEEL